MAQQLIRIQLQSRAVQRRYGFAITEGGKRVHIRRVDRRRPRILDGRPHLPANPDREVTSRPFPNVGDWLVAVIEDRPKGAQALYWCTMEEFTALPGQHRPSS